MSRRGLLLAALAVVMFAASVAIWFSGTIDLPIRASSRRIYFSGSSQVALGLAFLLVGALLARAARRPGRGDDAIVQIGIVGVFALLGLARVLARVY